MKIIAYGMVPIDEEVDDDFYLAHERIVKDYFKKFVHVVYRVEHAGRVYEDILIDIDEKKGEFDAHYFISGITRGGFYSVNGWRATERH